MTSAEMHYLNCDDSDCEKVYCVGRREFEQKILQKDWLIDRVKQLEQMLEEIKNDHWSSEHFNPIKYKVRQVLITDPREKK